MTDPKNQEENIPHSQTIKEEDIFSQFEEGGEEISSDDFNNPKGEEFDISSVVDLISEIISTNIPEESREEFQKKYKDIVVPFLSFLDVSSLIESNSASKSIPKPVKIILSIAVLIAPAVFFSRQYKQISKLEGGEAGE